MRQVGISTVLYTGDFTVYPSCLTKLTPGNHHYVWQTRLLSLMGNNRNAFFCPAALPQAAWNTNNTSVKSVFGEDGQIDKFGILCGDDNNNQGTRFSLGYNDWGIDRSGPILGMGADAGTPPVKDSAIRHPSEMIAIADVRSDTPDNQIQFSANTTPPVPWTTSQDPQWHPQVPCNRHNYRTGYTLFADGHVEGPLAKRRYRSQQFLAGAME